MSRSECDRVQEALVAGEQLAGAVEHARGCPECRAAVSMQARLVSALEARPRASVPVGMVERVVAGAIDRRRARRRQTTWLAAGGVVAVAAALVVVVMSGRDGAGSGGAGPSPEAAGTATVPQTPPTPEPPAGEATGDEQLYADLLLLSDVEAGLSHHARWDYVEEPISSALLLAPETHPMVGGPR